VSDPVHPVSVPLPVLASIAADRLTGQA